MTAALPLSVSPCAHVMAMAVQRLFPTARTTIGPCIENGFYYDFDIPEPITDADLKRVKAEMIKIIKSDMPLVRQQVTLEPPLCPCTPAGYTSRGLWPMRPLNHASAAHMETVGVMHCNAWSVCLFLGHA